MKIAKRLIPLSLAFLMVIGTATGCKGNKTANTSSSAEATPIKIFANQSTADESAPDKAWQAEIEKGANVKITWEVPPSSGYTDRLQVMLAGGDYPDIVYFADPTATTFTDAVNNGIVVPVTKQINNSPNIKKYSYSYSLDSLKVKGNSDIYGIPRTTVQRADGFIIRKDWADKVGFTIPSDNMLTTDQFKDLLTKFTKNDPDGNGKNDTYGWAGSSGTDGMGVMMSYAFGDKGWQKVTGEKYEYMAAMYDKESSNYKNALQFNQDIFKAGLIDPNAPSIKADAAKQRFKQGVTGCIGEFSGWLPTYLPDMQKLNPNVKLTYISGIKDSSGKFEMAQYGTGLWGFWAVTSSCKHVDAAVKMFDYMLSDGGWDTCKYGVKDSTYTEANGVKTATADYAKYNWGRAMVRRNNDASFFVTLDTPTEYKDPVNKWIDIAIKHKLSSLDFGYRPAAADKPALIDYTKTVNQTISKIITGAMPVSAWDQTLDGWYKAGGQEYVEQMNTQIKKTQGK